MVSEAEVMPSEHVKGSRVRTHSLGTPSSCTSSPSSSCCSCCSSRLLHLHLLFVLTFVVFVVFVVLVVPASTRLSLSPHVLGHVT